MDGADWNANLRSESGIENSRAVAAAERCLLDFAPQPPERETKAWTERDERKAIHPTARGFVAEPYYRGVRTQGAEPYYRVARNAGPDQYYPVPSPGAEHFPAVRTVATEPYESPQVERGGNFERFFEGVAWGLSVPVLLGATLDVTLRNWRFPCARTVLRFYGHSAWNGTKMGGRLTIKGCQLAGKHAMPAVRQGLGMAAHFVDELKRAGK